MQLLSFNIDSDNFVAIGVFPERRLKLINKQVNTTYLQNHIPQNCLKMFRNMLGVLLANPC